MFACYEVTCGPEGWACAPTAETLCNESVSAAQFQSVDILTATGNEEHLIQAVSFSSAGPAGNGAGKQSSFEYFPVHYSQTQTQAETQALWPGPIAWNDSFSTNSMPQQLDGWPSRLGPHPRPQLNTGTPQAVTSNQMRMKPPNHRQASRQ
ncbi:hypothetical protein WJX73_007700 [Symbiochloris irregularis]|uniref:Uncharacterized protein n=1 Tax=Symbiochloris irregularis TaxID=706552 RepID=A0AAW1PQB2_9CHLO